MDQPNVPPRPGITPDLVSDLIASAGRAPSLHNSQPWRFRLDGDVLELRADPQRAMRVSDPEARERKAERDRKAERKKRREHRTEEQNAVVTSLGEPFIGDSEAG